MTGKRAPHDEPIDEKRRLLLIAARAEFVEHGFHNANVHRMCERASVGIGSFYKRFSGKSDALLNVMQLWVRDFLGELEREPRSRADLHRSLDTLLTDITSTALRQAWRDAVVSDLSLREVADRLRGDQVRRVADLITRVRVNERVTAPPLSAIEAAWLIMLVMRDAPAGPNDIPHSPSLMGRILDLAIGDTATT